MTNTREESMEWGVGQIVPATLDTLGNVREDAFSLLGKRCQR
jgi:hypothetical protein